MGGHVCKRCAAPLWSLAVLRPGFHRTCKRRARDDAPVPPGIRQQGTQPRAGPASPSQPWAGADSGRTGGESVRGDSPGNWSGPERPCDGPGIQSGQQGRAHGPGSSPGQRRGAPGRKLDRVQRGRGSTRPDRRGVVLGGEQAGVLFGVELHVVDGRLIVCRPGEPPPLSVREHTKAFLEWLRSPRQGARRRGAGGRP